METVRAFIALDLGNNIKTQLGGLIQTLQMTGVDVRWVNPENLHLTLAFLGNVKVEKFQPLEIAMRSHVQFLEPFEISIQGTGVFGRRNRPSVVWAGLKESQELLNLHQQVVSSLRKADILYDNKPFRPHLTLGRFKSLTNVEALFQSLEKGNVQHFGSVMIQSVEIIKSELKPTGAIYTSLKSVPLTKG